MSLFTLTLHKNKETNQFHQRFVVSKLVKLSDELIQRLLSLNQMTQNWEYYAAGIHLKIVYYTTQNRRKIRL